MSFHTRLFVGNLPATTDDSELHTVFKQYGDVRNVDLKTKPGNEAQKFAFITMSSSNSDIESCIQHFSSQDYNGYRLYVTRARESFLERLQRERQEAQAKADAKEKIKKPSNQHPTMKINEKLNPRKRLLDNSKDSDMSRVHIKPNLNGDGAGKKNTFTSNDQKKNDSTKKRLESLQKKRQEFKQKQNIIKTGLIGIDKAPNKKIVFSNNDIDTTTSNGFDKKSIPDQKQVKGFLFEDSDNDNDDVNFEIKKQFEGKKGQKILELQSRFKSDKRFTLDERFTENDQTEAIENGHNEDEIVVSQMGEKAKQLNILQDVLGIAIRSRSTDTDALNSKKKSKSNLGMLRFDPMQPEHAKFLAPVEEKKHEKTKKNKTKEVGEIPDNTPEQEIEKVQVSKEQFYKVSDTLKEAIVEPNTFSLRSLFKSAEETVTNKEVEEQEANYIPLKKTKMQKVNNPLDPGESNPFKYDSSDSETEDVDESVKTENNPEITEVKAVWKENLFFSSFDSRLADGLSFFNQATNNKVKDRRELKAVMKKRLHNNERRDQKQMFQKKIGGKRKAIKKNFRRKT